MPGPSSFFDNEDDDTSAGGLVAKPVAGDNAAPFTITELSQLLKRTVEDRFGHVKLRGELSGVKRAASGHLYCCLKDEGAVIDGVMWRTGVQRLSFVPEDGVEVIAWGKLTTYPGRSKYQIVIEGMEIAGEGALLALLEKTRRRLEAEGLFASERKRPLPYLPSVIGVVTSPTGAVIRDILHRLADRFPSRVLVWPVMVQGQGAAEQVAAAVQGFCKLDANGSIPRPDLLIVARGGGSIEDLWAFNDEGVARAIRASVLPIVSGIGHEIDFTIADFVADARAPTPSGAAEMVVPDRRACLDVLARTADRLVVAMRREMRTVGSRFDAANARLKLMHPGTRLLQQEQRLDDLEQRLTGAMRTALHHNRSRVSEAMSTLLHHSPERRVKDMCLKYESLAARLQHAWASRSARAEHRLSLAARALNTVSPLATLERGFAIVTRGADDRLVTDVGSVQVGDEIRARVARGELRAKVTSKKEPGGE